MFSFFTLGRYLIFIRSLFINRESFSTYWKRFVDEFVLIGISSLPLTILVSVFMGGVTSIQTASNLVNPLTPKFIVGLATRNMVILELSPTILGIIIAGKVGSNIASQLSSMRISEQIDALEIFGINTSSYLVLPKILATVCAYPMLVIISIFCALSGGYVASVYIAKINPNDYISGLTMLVRSYELNLAIWKSLTFAFLMSSISSFVGYFTYGGSLSVGRASTIAFTSSCIAILIADYFVAQLFLSL